MASTGCRAPARVVFRDGIVVWDAREDIERH